MKKMALHGPVAAGGVRASHQASWRVRACARGYGRRAQSPHTALPPHTALCTSAVLTLPLPLSLDGALQLLRATRHALDAAHDACQGATGGNTGRDWAVGLRAAGGPQVLLYDGLHSGIPSFRGFNPSTWNSFRLFTSSARARTARKSTHTHRNRALSGAAPCKQRAEALRRALCSAQGVQGCRRVRVPTAGHPCRAPPRTHGAAHPAALRVPARPAHARRGADSQRRLLCFLGPSSSDDGARLQLPLRKACGKKSSSLFFFASHTVRVASEIRVSTCTHPVVVQAPGLRLQGSPRQRAVATLERLARLPHQRCERQRFTISQAGEKMFAEVRALAELVSGPCACTSASGRRERRAAVLTHGVCVWRAWRAWRASVRVCVCARVRACAGVRAALDVKSARACAPPCSPLCSRCRWAARPPRWQPPRRPEHTR